MKDKSGTATSKELSQWKRRFKIFFYGTPITVTAFFIAQICATKGSFSTEFSSLGNWKTFTDTFNLPIGVFTAMAAITTLIGMYYRSLQLAHQLNKVEDQIEIANQQFKKSEQQFELAQKQFELVNRKENFTLYWEHQKQIRSYIEEKIKLRKTNLEKAMKNEIPPIDFEFGRFYSAAFPENSPENMKNFSLLASEKHFDTGAQWFIRDLTEYGPLHRSVFDIELKLWGIEVDDCSENFKGDKVYKSTFLKSVYIILLVFRELNLIHDKTDVSIVRDYMND